MYPIFTLEQLHGLIGRRVTHHGVNCQIIEILDDGPALVLADCEANTTIQPDQMGDAHRRVPTTFTIPVLAEADEFHPAFLRLELLNEPR